MGGAGEWSLTCMLRTFLLCPLAVSMRIYNDFEINGASGETFKVFVAIFTTIKVVIFEESFSRSFIHLEIEISWHT